MLNLYYKKQYFDKPHFDNKKKPSIATFIYKYQKKKKQIKPESTLLVTTP